MDLNNFEDFDGSFIKQRAISLSFSLSRRRNYDITREVLESMHQVLDKVEQSGLVVPELMPANFLDLNFGSDIVLQRFTRGQ